MLVKSVFTLLAVLACYSGASAQGLGSTCTTDRDCTAINLAACVNNICACSGNFVAGPYNDKCLQKVEHAGVCEESIQCYYSEGTQCLNQRCVCKTGYNYNGQKCIGTLGLGDPCTADPDCRVSGDPNQDRVWCYNKQCACKRGYQRSGDRCIIGGDCTTDTDCADVENAFCDNRSRARFSCKCKEGYVGVANSTKCFKAADTLSAGCEYNEQCTQKLGKAECKNFQCQCTAGAKAKDDKTGCSSAVQNVVSVTSLVVLCLFKFF
ncbi:prion-like-(Q/N-rich) domain-bearing protein 25 [Periplaneta americana]|uniref:prion-like-(Q/N-rich) domain-bearing protein 25 n=1 Tax=Periplaneta americana TaxID=6978 RepID=UPI0037E724B1